MKVGDLVIRKIPTDRSLHHSSAIIDAKRQRQELGCGIIISKQMGGINPSHPCLTVLYPKVGKQWDIAECLMEVVSEVQ